MTAKAGIKESDRTAAMVTIFWKASFLNSYMWHSDISHPYPTN